MSRLLDSLLVGLLPGSRHFLLTTQHSTQAPTTTPPASHNFHLASNTTLIYLHLAELYAQLQLPQNITITADNPRLPTCTGTTQSNNMNQTVTLRRKMRPVDGGVVRPRKAPHPYPHGRMTSDGIAVSEELSEDPIDCSLARPRFLWSKTGVGTETGRSRSSPRKESHRKKDIIVRSDDVSGEKTQ
jgi:hypothetical protein